MPTELREMSSVMRAVTHARLSWRGNETKTLRHSLRGADHCLYCCVDLGLRPPHFAQQSRVVLPRRFQVGVRMARPAGEIGKNGQGAPLQRLSLGEPVGGLEQPS